jgi:hypothetical protein
MAWVLFAVVGQEILDVFEMQDQNILVCTVQELTAAVAVAATVVKYKHVITRCADKLHTTSQ